MDGMKFEDEMGAEIDTNTHKDSRNKKNMLFQGNENMISSETSTSRSPRIVYLSRNPELKTLLSSQGVPL